jgi:hypothetical protein
MPVDRLAPVRFLQTAYEHKDWVAVFLKSYATGRVAQRVGSIARIADSRFQAWLRAENATGANVYISVNAVAPGQRSRRRDAIRTIRHVFIDADNDAPKVLRTIATRSDVPPVRLLQSSPPTRPSGGKRLHHGRRRGASIWRVNSERIPQRHHVPRRRLPGFSITSTRHGISCRLSTATRCIHLPPSDARSATTPARPTRPSSRLMRSNEHVATQRPFRRRSGQHGASHVPRALSPPAIAPFGR